MATGYHVGQYRFRVKVGNSFFLCDKSIINPGICRMPWEHRREASNSAWHRNKTGSKKPVVGQDAKFMLMYNSKSIPKYTHMRPVCFCEPQDMDKNVHSCIFHNSQNTATARMSISNRMAKQIVMYFI